MKNIFSGNILGLCESELLSSSKKEERMIKGNKPFLGSLLCRLFIFAVFMIYCVLSLGKASQDVSAATVIKNVRIFDGERIIQNSTVVIEKGRIITVGQKAKVPEGAKIFDGEGQTLLPGLMDAHVHVWDPQNLKQALVFGVTTVVDMFMNVKTMKAIKEMQSTGKANDRAYLISPGTLVTVPGGHGTQYGAPIPTITRPEEAEEFVDSRIAEGSDFIKIIYDDGSAYSMPRPTLDKATLHAVIEAAHKKGMLAVVHAATLQNCVDVFEAEGDGLAHLFFNDAYHPQFGRLAARKKVFVIPTLTVLESMSGTSDDSSLTEDPYLSSYLSPMDIQMITMSFPFQTSRAAYEAAEKGLKQLKAEAVAILAGTDAPNPGTTYGASLHMELELLVNTGLSPLDALKAATSVPAEKFNLRDRGRIKPGYIADLVLVNGDPSQDIRATRNIVSVWRNGEKVNREKYLDEIEKEKAERERQKTAPPPEYSESGWISDFEGEKVAANFGAGWSVSTDTMMGGKSISQYQLVKEGAQGSQGALLITGNLVQGSQYQWAGALFSPGEGMMMPANLSFKKSINLWARGDGKAYVVMVFAQSLGFTPAFETFVAGSDWKEYTFPFEKFGVDGSDIMGIFIGASTDIGEFSLTIDNVRLK
jgi:imidazolonepropionase-like amidohydrolase